MKIETGRCMEPSSSIIPALDAQIWRLEALVHKSDNDIVDIDLLLAEAADPSSPSLSRGTIANLLIQAMESTVATIANTSPKVGFEVDYHEEVRYGQIIHITSKVVEQENGRIHLRSEIRLPNGIVAAVGRGIFYIFP